MKIERTGGVDVFRAYKNQLKKNEVEHKNDTGARADTLDISPEARKMQLYYKVLERIPEVREELVASLRQRIDEGTYRPDGGRIVAGLLEERLLDKRI